jgi:geranylgeranyl transferase type-2 subunit beta
LKKAEVTFKAAEHQKLSTDQFLATSLQMGGVYWTFTGLRCLKEVLTVEEESKVVDFIMSCYKNEGFSVAPSHYSNLTATHYALLCLKQLGKLDLVDKQRISDFVESLQKADGSFASDEFNDDSDVRFSYDAFAILHLLGYIRKSGCVERGIPYLKSCLDVSGKTFAFSTIPGAEPHAAYTFCGVAALAIAGELDLIDREKLGWWLCERQTVHGGFNGRPEKAPDVCYSWWILATLAIIEKMHYCDLRALRNFVLKAQDAEDGGIADRPGFAADVFHTFFGLAAVSLIDKELGEAEDSSCLNPVDPIWAIVL